jgi:hypothetical protein
MLLADVSVQQQVWILDILPHEVPIEGRDEWVAAANRRLA